MLRFLTGIPGTELSCFWNRCTYQASHPSPVDNPNEYPPGEWNTRLIRSFVCTEMNHRGREGRGVEEPATALQNNCWARGEKGGRQRLFSIERGVHGGRVGLYKGTQSAKDDLMRKRLAFVSWRKPFMQSSQWHAPHPRAERGDREMRINSKWQPGQTASLKLAAFM